MGKILEKTWRKWDKVAATFRLRLFAQALSLTTTRLQMGKREREKFIKN